MPVKTVYEGKVEHLSILDENGNFDEKLGEGLLTSDQLVHLYEQMTVCRQLDEIAFKLQRSGRMGTYPQNKGQEANAVGSALAMSKGEDWLVPSYRENAALFMHGLPMHHVLAYWMGDERGSAIPDGLKMLPLSVPIGTHMLHAAGIAWASKLRGEKNAVITYFGDGATSEGDFHGAMNFASTLQVPVIFYCQNNQWAISVPREEQMNSSTVAQKAFAYDIPTVQVDGNDVFACYKATKDARERAVGGGGPSFIEGVTYRLGDHTTADDARRYREADEVDAWKQKDPLIRLRIHMERLGCWDDAKQTALQERAEKVVQEVVKAANDFGDPEIGDMFDFMFETLPESLKIQRETMRTSSLGQQPGQIGLKTQPQHTS